MTDGTELPDHSAAYRGVRERMDAIVRDASPDDHMKMVPATPEWRVHDVISHVCGVTADIVAGRLDGVGTDPWTAVQVAERRDTPTLALLDEWNEHSIIVDPLVPQLGQASGQLVLDVTTHEHDIRDALGQPGARDTDAMHIASHWAAERIAEAHAATNNGALRIETNLWKETFGDGEPTVTVRVDAFELLRASTGRRSTAQIAGWEWNDAPRPEVIVLAIFQPRAEDFAG